MVKRVLFFIVILLAIFLPGYFIANFDKPDAPIIFFIIATPLYSIGFWFFSVVIVVGIAMFLGQIWDATKPIIPVFISDWESFRRSNKSAKQRWDEKIDGLKRK